MMEVHDGAVQKNNHLQPATRLALNFQICLLRPWVHSSSWSSATKLASGDGTCILRPGSYHVSFIGGGGGRDWCPTRDASHGMELRGHADKICILLNHQGRLRDWCPARDTSHGMECYKNVDKTCIVLNHPSFI